jgi:tetratricopeptide (TPR) repeat protein
MLGNPNVPNLGQREEALRKYELARANVVRAVAVRPEDNDAKLAEARIDASVGDVLLAQRRLDEARIVYEHGAAIVQSLLTADPDNDALRQALAGIYRPLGEVQLAASNPDEALAIFEKARALDLAAVARTPDAADAQRLLALSQLRVGEALAAIGRKAEAIQAYREASRLLGALSSQEPVKARLARDVAVSRMKLGTLVNADADARGVVELEQALTTFRELARLDPRNAGAQRDVLVALVALGDAVANTNAGRARERYIEAQRVAERLHAEPFDDPQAERDLRIVRERLTSAPLRTIDPELRLALVRDGSNVPLDKYAPPPVIGEDLRLSWKGGGGQAEYVLVLGGEGRASLLSREEIAAAGWQLKASGPPPSQTLLLISASHALAPAERAALIDRISNVPGPRRVPPDAHILWRSHQPETLDSTSTARGGSDLDWPALVRAELERMPDLRFTGRTFPVTTR